MAKGRVRAPVTLRALLARLNRALAKDGRRLVIGRGAAAESMGRYYLVSQTTVVEKNVNPEKLARDLGVLREWEGVQQE